MTTLLSLPWMLWAAVTPALLLFAYIWWRDPKKEPLSELLKALALGVSICIPVALIEYGIKTLLFGPNGEPVTLFGTTMEAFFVAALPEEGAKLLVLWLLLRKNKYFDEHIDGIVYAVCVGLGFALIENIMYVVTSDNWAMVALMRSLLSVPGHYAFAIMMGYYFSLYHFVDHTPKNAFLMIFAPFMAHGIYDSLAMSGSVNPVVGGLAFVGLIIFCIWMQRHAQRRIADMANRDNQISLFNQDNLE